MVDIIKHDYCKSVVGRFWKYVNKGLEDECWLWVGGTMKRGGYGQLNDRHTLLKAHRVSYEIHKGKFLMS